MFIEFIGLPASGKTTIAKEIYKRLNNSKVVIFPLKTLYEKKLIKRNLYKFGSVALYCLHHLSVLRNVISIIVDSKQRRKLDNFRLSFNLLFFLSVRERYKNEKRIVIFDEGFVHHVWAVSVNSKCKNLHVLFKNIIKKIDVTIKVECPVELIQSRMKTRKDNNERHLDFINNIDEINTVMKNIIEYFVDENYICSYTVIQNVNQSDINVNCDYIISKYFNNVIEGTILN
jgi:adenylate kinase family enzyme